MQKIIYPLRDFSLGLVTAGEESERPWNSCDTLTNYLWDRRWKRKSGSAIYNATYMHATEEVRGGLTFNDGTINCILAFCNGSGYKTTGGGSMGSALTEPDGTAVTWGNADLDVFGAMIRDRLYLHNGDTTDPPLVFDGTYLVDMAIHGSATADADGTTTTFPDDSLDEADDYWNGQSIVITDAGDGTIHRAYITDFDQTGGAAEGLLTFSPARDSAVVTGDTCVLGVVGQEERNGKFTILHKNRIFTAVGSLLYYTVPYYPDWWGPEDGYVTLKKPGWKDGEDITALAVMDDNLIVFKPHNIYAIRTTGKHYNWTVTKIVGTDSNKGCVWHKTLDRGFGGLIYHSWDGVYVLDRSLNVHCVSRNIEPTIKALQQSISNPGGMSGVTKIDTSKADFDAGSAPDTNIDTATVSGTFRVDKTTEAVEQQNDTGTSSGKSWAGPRAQSFTTSKACICTKAQLYIKKTGSPPNFILYLKDDDSNSPGSTLISKTVSAASISTTAGYIDFNWTDTNLANATKYWLYVPIIGDVSNYYTIYIDTENSYANGNAWEDGIHYTDDDYKFKVWEQHYEATSEFISQIFNLTAVPTSWGIFNATETLNGCSIAWTVRSDDDSGMASPTAWTAIENGGIPSITLQQYVQYRAVPTPTNVATPVVDDVTIRATLGTAVDAPCAIVHDKKYWLSVKDTSSSVNSCVYVLDEEALMYEQHERWSKITGWYINEFFIFNDQLMGTSVGGTGKGGFLYYLDTGTKDLGVDFTTTLTTQKLDFSNLDPTYRDREKVYKKLLSKYKSQQDASLYYKIDSGSWSDAITLSAQANVDIEEDFFSGLQRGKYSQYKVTQAIADPDFEWHGIDILARIARLRN